MDPMEAIKITFFQECEEQLSELEQGLLALEGGEAEADTVNAVFRAVHSIKGGAGAFGLEALVRFAHVFETTLDDVRSERITAGPELLRVMLRSNDVLADLVRAARDGGTVDEARTGALAEELAAFCAGGPAGGEEAEGGSDDDFDFDFQPLTFDVVEAGPSDGWTVSFTPQASLYANGNEPGLLLRELARLGEAKVSVDVARLPALEDLDPESAVLGWTVELDSSVSETAIREVFEFVEDECALSVTALGGETAAEPEAPAFDITALIAQAQAAVEELAPEAPVAQKEPQAAAAGSAAAAPAQQTIRVDLERVDRLIDLVGELVIQQAMLAQKVVESGLARSSAVSVGLDDLEHLTRDIQDSVMAIRAQPVKSVFQRMPRLVREVAAMVNKEVRLVTEGEGTEVDKTVIERLSDPITHMIRNAIDHGLESSEARLAAGKPVEGVVKLSARHRSGRIVIEVSDDGGGINRQRVRAIAVDKGLIEPDVALTDEEIDNLIFLPGFSTASEVSDISGRGVGMDVVRRSIQALGGRISITSRPGHGSTFTMSLPLTLAVLDGMVVTVGGQTLVAPLTTIVETLRPKPSEVRELGVEARVIAIRDSFVPLVDVGLELGYRAEPAAPEDGVVLLVECDGGARAALAVDAIQGQRQVVIKSLEANYRQVPGVAAATILGDGRVALILDVDALVSLRRREAARPEFKLQAAG